MAEDGAPVVKKFTRYIKMTSAGLIFKYYGKEILKNIAKTEYKRDLDDTTLDTLYDKIYKSIIMEIDAITCGVF